MFGNARNIVPEMQLITLKKSSPQPSRELFFMVLETLGLIVIIRRGENGNQEHNQDNHNDPERQSKLHWKIHLVHLQLTAFIIPNLTGKENGKSCEHIVTDFGDGFMVCVALPEKWA